MLWVCLISWAAAAASFVCYVLWLVCVQSSAARANGMILLRWHVERSCGDAGSVCDSLPDSSLCVQEWNACDLASLTGVWESRERLVRLCV